MGRKKNPTSEIDVGGKMKTPLAQNLDNLITDANALKDHLGCSIQAINQYRLGVSRPSLENLCKIAKFYGVTTDYLLGLSDIPTNKPDINAACLTTGLSQRAVNFLYSLSHDPHGELGVTAKGYTVSVVSILSDLLESQMILRLFSSLGFYLIYGGALPPDAYTSDVQELSFEEHQRFHKWANERGLEIQPRENICEMHLQTACDELKSIFRDILKGRKENGQHQKRD